MLECRVCLAVLPESDFYASSLSRCKACFRDYGRAYRAKRAAEKLASKPADWKKKTADKAAYQRAWRLAHPGYATRKKAEWLKANPEARQAKERRKYDNGLKRVGRKRVELLTADEKKMRASCRQIWRMAVRRGKVQKRPCVRCSALVADGHHEDYTRPLDVVWLCKVCHVAEHVALRSCGSTG